MNKILIAMSLLLASCTQMQVHEFIGHTHEDDEKYRVVEDVKYSTACRDGVEYVVGKHSGTLMYPSPKQSGKCK